MGAKGTLFGWAFGDADRQDETAYMDSLRSEALANARQDAASRGFDVEHGTETYTVLSQGDTLVELDAAPDTLVVRCTVRLVGPGTEKIHGEGPMNG